MVLIFNINTYGSAANGGQHLQKFLIFIQDVHPSADHQRVSRSSGNHGECKPSGRPPNQRETMPLKCTKNMGAKENGDNTNHKAWSDLRTAAPILRPQRRQGSQAATGGDRYSKSTQSKNSRHIALEGSNWRTEGRNDCSTHTVFNKRTRINKN